MMSARIWGLRALYRFVLYPGLRMYWWIFRPKTFGALILVSAPETGRILLIRQSYGARDLWRLPGGGYNPGLEGPEEAAVREAYEETGVRVRGVRHLLEDVHNAYGNHDQRQVFTADLEAQDQISSVEVIEMRWVSRAETAEMNLSRLTRLALAESERDRTN